LRLRRPPLVLQRLYPSGFLLHPPAEAGSQHDCLGRGRQTPVTLLHSAAFLRRKPEPATEVPRQILKPWGSWTPGSPKRRAFKPLLEQRRPCSFRLDPPEPRPKPRHRWTVPIGVSRPPLRPLLTDSIRPSEYFRPAGLLDPPQEAGCSAPPLATVPFALVGLRHFAAPE